MHHNQDTSKHEASVEPGIKPVPNRLYPTMDSLQSAVDLAFSQTPEVPQNTVLRLLMIYHNTLLAAIKKAEK